MIKKVINILPEILRSLDKKPRFLIIILILNLVLVSFLDVISIGMLAGFVGFLTSPEVFINKIPIKFVQDTFLSTGFMDLILYFSILIVILLIIKNFIMLLILKFENYLRVKITKINGVKSFKSILNRSYIYFTKFNLGNIKNEIYEESERATGYVFYGINLIKEVILAFFIIFALIFINFKITFSILSILIFFSYLTIFLIRKKIINFSDLKKKYTGEAFKIIIETIQNIQFIKLSGKSDYFVASYGNNLEKGIYNSQIMKVINFVPKSILEISSVTFLLIFSYLLFLKGFEIGFIVTTLSFLVLSVIRLMPSINNFNTCLNGLIYCRKSFLNFNELVKSNKKIENEVNLESIESIKLRDVEFSYTDGKFKLSNLNISLEKNKIFGIAGKNGSGKSTLINLVLGLITPSKGKIILNDKFELSSSKLSLHRKVGLIPQNIFLIDDTISRNVAFGIPQDQIDYQKVKDVLKISLAEELIEHIKKNENYFIGDKGNKLSGGQKQRVAIARALYSNPSIIIFDEPTSALDANSKNLFFSILNKIQKDRIILIISHDHKILNLCSKLIVLKNGKFQNIDEQSIKTFNEENLKGLI